MTYRQPARTPRRVGIRSLRVGALLVVVAAIAAALGHQGPASSSPTAASRTEHRPAREEADRPGRPGAPARDRRRARDEADGALPDRTTVFDDDIPGVANLDPALLGALRRAATRAADDGVELYVDSGWRSPEYQEHLLRQAIARYGSEAEAARWVATPATSAHVSGDAVDIGPAGATAWLSAHGAAYGLCRIYRNEPWHYELRPGAVAHGCPAMYADAAHDPRMQR